MTPIATTIGSLPGIIRNDEGLYEGNLIHYFRVLFYHAQNLRRPYHNFRHMFHVTYLCYQACAFYRTMLVPRQMRNLLIAALFHDFDHSGMAGNDDLNIMRAIRGLYSHILPEDKPHFEEITALIGATEYPHKDLGETIGLSGRIIRDADMAQAMSETWIQEVVIGLATEWNMPPIEVLVSQITFNANLKFHTAWAQEVFPQFAIDAKTAEARELLAIL